MKADTIGLIRAVRGAPLSILTVFVLEGRSLGHNFLVEATGYSKDTVTQALKALYAVDLIEPLFGVRYNGWVATDKAFTIFGSNSSPIFQDSTGQIELLFGRQNEDADSLVIVDSSSSRKFDIIRALHDAGIYGSAANKIALDPTITLDYVTGMIRENHSSPALLAKKILRHENE